MSTLWGISSLNPLIWFAAPIYMHQIHERVALSRNIGTLFALALLITVLMIFGAILEYLRQRALQRLAVDVDAHLTKRVFDTLRLSRDPVPSNQPLLEVEALRNFISGHGLANFFDATWAPLIMIFLFIIHPVLGLVCSLMLVLTALTAIAAYYASRNPTTAANRLNVRAREVGNGIATNAEIARSMGMIERLRERWQRVHLAQIGWQGLASDRLNVIEAFSSFLRHMQIPIIYTVGALLYLENELSISTVTLASLVMMRGLGPINGIIHGWRSYARASEAIENLGAVFNRPQLAVSPVTLPPPRGALTVSRVVGAAPGSEKVIVNDVSFSALPGSILGIVGASGAGKSSLAKLLVGAWKPRRGAISIGEHDLSHWSQEQLGDCIGYMAQQTDFFRGSIAENISRFRPGIEADSESLIAASNLSDIGDIIRELPDGFSTMVGPGGQTMSGGQMQRLALARAVFGDPHLIVLDEPSSQLDAVGEQALAEALQRLRADGRIVIVITHKLSFLNICDNVLVLHAGTVQAHGRREHIVDRVARLQAMRGAVEHRWPRIVRFTVMMSESVLVATAPKADADWQRTITRGFGVVLAVFASLIIWMTFARIDSAVVAVGQISVESNRKTIQHLEGGIVREILVRDGAVVKQGDVVMRLDSTRAEASDQLYRKQRAIARLQEARLLAQREERDFFDIPADVQAMADDEVIAAAIRDNRSQFETRRDNYKSAVDILKQQIAQGGSDAEQARTDRDTAERQLETFSKELPAIRDLYKRGLASLPRLTGLERQEQAAKAALSKADIDLTRSKDKASEFEARLRQLRQENVQEAANLLVDARKAISDVAQQLIVAGDSLRRVDLFAPVSGTVQQLRVFTVGGIVKAGDPIMDIVPQNDALVARARISPIDIDRLRVGQDVRIRLPQFAKYESQIMLGRVTTISRDTLIDAADRQPYYSMEIVADKATVPQHVAENLTAGMTVEIIAPTGERTAMEYFLSPILDRLAGSLRER